MISTGIEYLDKCTGGFQPGDNVVWQVADAVPFRSFIRAFFKNKPDFVKSIVFVSFNHSPHTICKKYDFLFSSNNVVLLDAFTHGKGNSDPVFMDFYSEEKRSSPEFVCIKEPGNPSEFRAALNDIERKKTDGTFYFFDSLTGMKELWKDERAVLDFFAFTCPKLYDLNTLAYWSYEREAHSREFIAGLTHITQVVFDIRSSHQDYYEFRVKKIEGPSRKVSSDSHYFRVSEAGIEFDTRRVRELFTIGEKVKYQRKVFRITQSDLADSLGLTPGAVSQIENSVSLPSLHTLMQLSDIFKKPFEYFLGGDLGQTFRKGYEVFHKKPFRKNEHSGYLLENLMNSQGGKSAAYLVTLEPGGSVDEPLVLHKRQEFLTVIKGSCVIHAGNNEEHLVEGDSLLLSDVFVTRIKCTSQEQCLFVYVLL